MPEITFTPLSWIFDQTKENIAKYKKQFYIERNDRLYSYGYFIANDEQGALDEMAKKSGFRDFEHLLERYPNRKRENLTIRIAASDLEMIDHPVD